VLFGDLPSNGPEVAVNVDGSSKTLRSLWFDAGKWYNLSGATLTLGGGLVNNDPVITVNADWSGMSEINIDNNIAFNFGGVIGASTRALSITNNSEGGLRLGGTVRFNNGNFQGFSFLVVGGHGATHFANRIGGRGLMMTQSNQTTHLVLSGNNTSWQGLVGVNTESLAFIKRNNALPGIQPSGGSTTTRANVASGGTLGFRSHGHGPALNYTTNHTIQVQGQGAVRQWGRPPVGAVYNDGGQNTFRGDITMAGDTWFGSRGDRNGGLTLTGQITGGSNSFTKVGPGLITLTNANNSWTGTTNLNGGVLRIPSRNSTALPTTSNIVFNGGILESGKVGNSFSDLFLSYTLGTGAGQVRWNNESGHNGSGGFSNFTPGNVGTSSGFFVSLLDGNGQATELFWGQQYFVPVGKELLLSSRYANALVALGNGIAAGGAIIRVERGLTADAWAGVAGQVTAGSGGTFTKRGLGFLNLAASNNNYSAQTLIEQGALGGTISPNSNIILRGGVVMLGANGTNETFTRTVGTTPGQIQWNGLWYDETLNNYPRPVNGGGFAAWSGDQTVRLNNSTSLIYWEGSFVQLGMPLKFGHYTASGTIIWDKQMGWSSEHIYNIDVERGRDLSRADVVFNQAITTDGSQGILSITGDGRMDIAVENPQFQAIVQIYGAELRLNGLGSLSAMSPSLSIRGGGILTLDNRGKHDASTGGSYLANRLPEGLSVSMDSGAQFRLWGRGDYGPSINFRSTLQSLERISTERGAIHIELTQNHTQSYTQLTIEYILRRSTEHIVNGPNLVATSTLNLTSNSTYRAGNESVSLRFSKWGNIIQLGVGGVGVSTNYEINDHEKGDKIIPWATVKGQDWVMPQKNGEYTYLIALPQYHTNTDTNGWNLGHNVSVSSQAALGSDRTINSLRLVEQAKLDLEKFDLTLNSGGLLSNGKTMISSEGGRLMGV